METTKLPTTLINEYFAELSYPEIKEIKPCLFDTSGDVYLVQFENKTTSNTLSYAPINEASGGVYNVPFPNAYAIVIGDKVTGYHEEFWKDADVYRLVLKQHLGMLQMDAKTKEPETVVKPPQEEREGYCKSETVDAIVIRYEEILTKAQIGATDRIAEGLNRELELTGRLNATEAELAATRDKLEAIRQVLNGKNADSVDAAPPSPESCMISQGNVDFLNDDLESNEAAIVGRNGGFGPADAYPVMAIPRGEDLRVLNNGSWRTPSQVAVTKDSNGQTQLFVQVPPVDSSI